jgi:nitrilase
MTTAARIAAAQFAPVYMDRDATIARACDLIREAAADGAKLVVFPEAFVPGYPDWTWVVPNYDGKTRNALHARLLDQAVTIPSEATDVLGAAAAEAGVHVVIGVHERNAESSGGSVFNSLLFLDSSGEILGKHRKLMPTGAERQVWAQGDGTTLRVYDTPFGRLGGLICWESFMPLARAALYDAGVQVLVIPTWDKSDGWLTAMQFIAREAGAFVVSCCMALRTSDVPEELGFTTLYPTPREWINTGRSCVIGPNGAVLAGPLDGEEGFVTADIELADISAAKRTWDVAGHYARRDVFDLSVRGLD